VSHPRGITDEADSAELNEERADGRNEGVDDGRFDGRDQDTIGEQPVEVIASLNASIPAASGSLYDRVAIDLQPIERLTHETHGPAVDYHFDALHSLHATPHQSMFTAAA